MTTALLSGAGVRAEPRSLVFRCAADNDLFLATQAVVPGALRYATADQAVRSASDGSGVLILADDYPERGVTITQDVLRRAEAKDLRLLVEFPASLPGLELGPVRQDRRERVVVVSELFSGQGLKRLRLLQINADG